MRKLKKRREQYESELDIHNFGDSCEYLKRQLEQKPLILPINTKKRPREKRITEIGEHMKTQVLFGLEFDLTHLQVREKSDSPISEADEDLEFYTFILQNSKRYN